MRVMIDGLAGWVRMEKARNESVRVVDTALTVAGTLLLATTWALLRP